MNPARASLPDIDLDFCSRRRDEVLAYVRDTYGEDKVALVATISTMRPKSAVRETAKAYGLDERAVKELIALLPRDWHPDPRRRQDFQLDDVLARIDAERAREVVRLAYRIKGQPHHLSIHPGGIVITPGPLTDFVPVQMAPKGFLITQFDYRDVETIGLPKIDLLGIRALTVLADTAELVCAHHDPDFRLVDIPAEDTKTGELLARVSLQAKEIAHLIRCGALDGLGESRAALLAEAEAIGRAGSAHQMAFAFATDTAVSPETPAQRLEWEHHILNQPISVHPLDLAPRPKNTVSLRQLPIQPPNHPTTIIGARLPGWTRGRGFFFGDGDSFVVVRLAKDASGRDKVKAWRPLRLAGHWRQDEWGSGWFEAESFQTL